MTLAASTPTAPKPPAPPAAAPTPKPAAREEPPAALVASVKTFNFHPGPGNPWPMFGATIRSILAAKKTIFLGLLLLIPVLITIVIANSPGGLKKYGDDYEQNPEFAESALPDDYTGGLLWFQDMALGLLFPFLIPLVVAIFAAGIIREEVDAKTLPYLFTRPIYRNWFVLPKYLAICVSLSILVGATLTVFWFVSVSITENPFKHVGQLFGVYWVVVLTIFATAALFTFIGNLFKRAAIAIGLYLFIWEAGLSNIPARFIQRASIVHYEKAILAKVMDRDILFDPQNPIGDTGAVLGHVVLLALAIGGLLGALYVVSVKDYNV